ncbi:response regulator [uncultured Jatrophihabitans sp.]|uniref:response regulator n=1 Tax=uncultured Jatrophihabitans sp. TaxID=1610747 RepID=UPI0035CC07A9
MTDQSSQHAYILATAVDRLLEQHMRLPLRSMLGSLELLGMSELDGEQRAAFDGLMVEADGMAHAVERLRSLCHVEIADGPVAQRPFVLPELLGAVAAGVHAEVAVKVDVDVPLRLVGDEAALRRLLTELVDNAVTHACGPYLVHVSRGDGGVDELAFSVSDGGGGLSDIERIILTRGRADAGRPGDGVGLHLVRRTTVRLGGSVTDSASAGGRHTICVRVAVPPADPPPAAMEADPAPARVDAPPPVVAGPAPRRLHVLLVEDNAVNAILAQRQLKLLGHDLQVATRGADGVRCALDGGYDVILMDRHLPDLDGVQAAREIWAGEAGAGRQRTPVIAMTADAMARNRDECMAAGMDGFLTKPVDLEDLRAALDGVAASLARATTQDDIIDHGVLGVLAEQLNAPEMVVELRRAFVAELPLRRLRLQAAIRRSSPGDVFETAEVFRASSETVGARRLAGVCRQMAEAAHQGNTAQAHRLIPALREACQLTSTALNSAPAPAPAPV